MDEINGLVSVRQLPVIEDRLKEIKGSVTNRLHEIDSLVCTVDTLSNIKAARATIRKELAAYDAEKSAVLATILEPIDRFRRVYDDCIGCPYRATDGKLKAKISDIEGVLKAKCQEKLQEYFFELRTAYHVEWLDFERSRVSVDMVSARQKTPKKLMEQLYAFVMSVSNDVSLIINMDHAAEILCEYKLSLNLSSALSAVDDRHKRIEQEQRYLASINSFYGPDGTGKDGFFSPPVAGQAEEPIESQAAPPEQVVSVAFKVTAGKSKIKRLRDYMVEEGISYE